MTLTLAFKKNHSLENQDRIHFQSKVLTPVNDLKTEDEKTEQQKNREKFKKTLEWLLSSFPKCLNLKKPLPLKSHIEHDIYKHLSDDDESKRGPVEEPPKVFVLS